MMDLDGESNSERRKNGTGIAIPTSSGDEVAFAAVVIHAMKCVAALEPNHHPHLQLWRGTLILPSLVEESTNFHLIGYQSLVLNFFIWINIHRKMNFKNIEIKKILETTPCMPNSA
jgi:hypothetical protein